MKSYMLDVRDGSSLYTIEDRLRNPKARGCMLYSDSLNNLDNLTAKFLSFEDMQKEFQEIYNSKFKVYDPIVIVDQDDDYGNSYFIQDIVYEEDKKILDNIDYLKSWLSDYLKRNPEDIHKFSGIKDIYLSLYGDREVNSYIIDRVVYAYFSRQSYKKYRDAYFKLKELDPSKVNKNGLHK